MHLKNRLSLGFTAGLMAGLVMDTIDQLFYFTTKAHTLRSVDWVAVLVYGHKNHNYFELLLSQIIHLIFSALLGMLFIYFVSRINNKINLLTGWLWAIFIWFFAVILTMPLNIPSLTNIRITTIAFHFILASVYGLVLALTIRRLKNTPTLGDDLG